MVEDISADSAAYVQIKAALQKIENRAEDGTLLVLKGHLVLEELIRAKLEAAVQEPNQLRRANLNFFNVLGVARAVFGDVQDASHGEPRSLWDVVEAWNTLRNRLAHRIEPTDTVQILRRIIYWVPDWSRDLEHEDTQNCLSIVIGMLIAGLGSLEPPAAKTNKITNPTSEAACGIPLIRGP
jgi:hypothetical protein